MKLHSLAKRLTAALLSGAMALSLCAPALAAGADVLPQLSVPGAQPLTAENSSGSFTINDQRYALPSDGGNLAYESLVGGSIFYSSANQQLTLTGPFSSKMDISAPGINVVMSSSDGSVVANDLTITASASVSISNEGSAAQAITGTADITSDGDVRITGTDRAVGGKMLTVNAGGDVEITGSCAGAAIWHSANITSGGSVTIGSTSANGWAQGSKNEGEKLTINAAQNVTLTGNGTTSYPVVNNASIQCGGDLKIEATNTDGKAAGGTLTYRNTSSAEKVLRDANSFKVVTAGDWDRISSTANLITAQAEQRYTVTVENGYALDASGTRRTAFYKGEKVTLVAQRPASTDDFRGWEAAGITFEPDSTERTVTFTMPDHNVSVTTNWNENPDAEVRLSVKVSSADAAYIFQPFGQIVQWDPTGGTNNSMEVRYQDGTFTFTGNWPANTSVSFTAFAPTASQLPSVVLNGSVGGDLTVESVNDFTVSDTSGDYTSYSYYLINGHATFTGCTGSVTLTSHIGSAVSDLTADIGGDLTVDAAIYPLYDTLTVTNARDVTLKGGDGPLIGAYNHTTHTIHCSGTVTLENRGDGKLISSTDTLVYTQADGFPYTITKDGVTGDVQTSSCTFASGELDSVSKLVIAPQLPDVPTEDITGSGAGNVGGAIAAAMVGGAAVWGGYEVVTRVMLHKLLPEGAAIPTTRGELALLLWNTAGRPEPANVPAFADTADTELAKAAQWCTEQGCLTAQDDGTFKPDKHVTKYSVIRTWTKAFPKQ